MRDIDESPNVQWFRREDYLCRMCGKRAGGELFGTRNESFGLHCQKCADKRIAAAKRVRATLAEEGRDDARRSLRETSI